MIQQESRLTVCDNSGAKEALCIRVLGGTSESVMLCWGCHCSCFYKVLSPASDVKKVQYQGFIVRTKKKSVVLMVLISVLMITLAYC